ncbi:hypothetical protein [Winogradskyella thalassocola]|uniref:Uncharacterized protein n=1 Tax=Winogradskyella thalassocola TaxID=262004 RepID=A0A1G8CUA0_9FLAO|nr:hypothetical protein [Winogradskyella thalassocola]SDH49097.1 hypothetical protein SAMN04489796_10351 [Winogradskyella thalassocola]
MNKIGHKTSALIMMFCILMSCGESNSKIILNTKEGIESIKELLQKEFDENKAITRLSISNKNRTSNEVDQITIMFVENDMNVMWFYSLTTAKLFKPESKAKHNTPHKALKIKEFNIDKIRSYFNKAVTMITTETDEFNNFQIGSYDMDINQDSNKIEHFFKIYANKTDEKTSFYGKRIKGNMFSFSFKTDKNGSLSSKDLDVFKK